MERENKTEKKDVDDGESSIEPEDIKKVKRSGKQDWQDILTAVQW